MANPFGNIGITKNPLSTGVVIGLILLVGCLNLINVKLSLALIMGLTFVFILHLKPTYSLSTLIFLAPFSGTKLISEQLAGIPGLKISNLILVAVVGAFILSKRQFKAKKPETVFILGSILLLTISIVRSLPHLNIINVYFGLAMTPEKYIVSYLIKPAFFLLPLIIISGYMINRTDVEFVTKSFRNCIFILSAFLLVYYLFFIQSKMNFIHVRHCFRDLFGIHTNGLVDFYILGYPILLAWFLYQKNVFNTINLFCALASIAVLYSRTAYILVVFATIFFLILEKKKRLLPIFVFIGICAVFIAPDTVIDRGLTGVEQGNMQTFSAGRVGGIWLPLLADVWNNPEKALVGSGRYAVIHSSPLSLAKGHAHNMFLTTFLDTGVVGLSFFVLFFLYFLKEISKGLKFLPKAQDRILLNGALVSIISFLIAGMTGRNFFPEMSNSYLWIVLGIALNIIRLHQKGRDTSYGI